MHPCVNIYEYFTCRWYSPLFSFSDVMISSLSGNSCSGLFFKFLYLHKPTVLYWHISSKQPLLRHTFNGSNAHLSFSTSMSFPTLTHSINPLFWEASFPWRAMVLSLTAWTSFHCPILFVFCRLCLFNPQWPCCIWAFLCSWSVLFM